MMGLEMILDTQKIRPPFMFQRPLRSEAYKVRPSVP
jgi:hypothetical protein